MKKQLRLFYLITAISVMIFASCDSSGPEKEISLAVKVYENENSIESSISIEEGTNNQKYVSISFKNTGQKVANIDSLEIFINPTKPFTKQTRLIFGGSCMGRTPLQQEVAGSSNYKSSTFLMAENSDKSYVHLGILTWNTFMPYIHGSEKGILISAQGERKPLRPGETVSFEKLVLTEGDSWQDLMFKHGEAIAKEHNIQKVKPLNLKGWSTWDYYGRVFSTKDVIKNIDQLSNEDIGANMIQIDGGWWTGRGDYLSVRKDLQGGMKAIAEYSKSHGYLPGIHLDGFRADLKSEIYKKHPEWFLKDQDGETISQPIDKGDTFMDYIYFDYSNPEVCEYMKSIMSTIRKDWGFRYFKIDFMRYGLYETIMTLHGIKNTKGYKKVTQIQSFDPSMTSVERTRAGLKAMRAGIDDAFFLGCSSIFGPTLGIVDGLRTGGDISPRYEYYQTRCLQNGGNFYLNQSVVQTDADYLVLRNKHDEEPERAWGKHKFGGTTTFNEAKMWSDYVALYGGIKINSDNLLTLRKERKQLIKRSFEHKTAERFIPLDLWEHGKNDVDAFNVMLAQNKDGVFLSLFNWDDADKTINLKGLSNVEFIEPETGEKIALNGDTYKAILNTHTSDIIQIKGKSFDELRKMIQVTFN